MKKNFYYLLAIFGIGLGAVGCSEDNNGTEHPVELKVSDDEIIFKAYNSEPVTVEVTSGGEWTYFDDYGTWVHIDEGPESLTISVDNYDGNEPRNSRITIASGQARAYIDIIQNNSGNKYVEFSDEASYSNAFFVSENGRYVLISGESGTTMVYDTQEDKLETINGGIPMAVTNDGIIAGASEVSGRPALLSNGTWTDMDVSGAISDWSGFYDGGITGISSDGTVISGYSNFNFGKKNIPWIFESGQARLLENPDTEWSGKKEPQNWARTSGMSADGSVIVGAQRSFDGFADPAVLWKKGTGYSFEYITKLMKKRDIDYYDELEELPENIVVSKNGRYVGGRFGILNLTTENYGFYGFIYDLATDTFEKFPDAAPDDWRQTSAITDDGLVFARSGYTFPFAGYVYDNGKEHDISSWMATNYGLKVPVTTYVLDCSSDGKVIAGAYMDNTTYELKTIIIILE